LLEEPRIFSGDTYLLRYGLNEFKFVGDKAVFCFAGEM
jgi:hypothetical protein